MSWADNKVQPGKFLPEIKKLIESKEISGEYTPEAIALFCFLYNSGFYPTVGQKMSWKQSVLISKYLIEAVDIPLEDIKNWPVLRSQYIPIFKKIGSDVSLINTLKKYRLLNQ